MRIGENDCVTEKNRGNPSLGDIIRTTAVMGALILALAGIAWWFSIEPTQTERSVDYESALVSARRDAAFELLAPRSLPEGWYANSVRYEPGVKGRWHLGIITETDAYIGLEQTPVSIRRTVEEYAPETEAKGNVTAGGFEWRLRQSPKGETSLVRRTDGITVLVTGTATRAVIEKYAASLSAR